MTWSIRISDKSGIFPENKWQACEVCKHRQKNPALPRLVYSPCNIPLVATHIGPLLTSVDVGADGHMAGGEALLKCFGFEPMAIANAGDNN